MNDNMGCGAALVAVFTFISAIFSCTAAIDDKIKDEKYQWQHRDDEKARHREENAREKANKAARDRMEVQTLAERAETQRSLDATAKWQREATEESADPMQKAYAKTRRLVKEAAADRMRLAGTPSIERGEKPWRPGIPFDSGCGSGPAAGITLNFINHIDPRGHMWWGCALNPTGQRMVRQYQYEVEFDCAARRLRTVRTIEYNDGQMAHDTATAELMRPVVLGSFEFDAALLDLACAIPP